MTQPKRANAIKISKVVLTDKSIKRLAKSPALPGQRYTVWDAALPGFGVEGSPTGGI